MNLTPPMPLWARAQTELLDTEAMAAARRWIASTAWGLLLLGGVGRGKSQAAAWLWLRLNEEDIAAAQAPGVFLPRGGVLWLRARVLQRLTWDDRALVLRRCAGAYGLVVDELGGEDERTGQALVDVLEERGDLQRRTVITTNLASREIVERYGDRLTSRLRSGGIDNGRARWAIAVDGADLRGQESEPTPSVEPAGEQVTPAQIEAIRAEIERAAGVMAWTPTNDPDRAPIRVDDDARRGRIQRQLEQLKARGSE